MHPWYYIAAVAAWLAILAVVWWTEERDRAEWLHPKPKNPPAGKEDREYYE
jgi:hypothetical protein